MRIVVGITHYSEDDPHFLLWLIKNYSTQIADALKYELIQVIQGKHIDAKRPHYHMNILMETHDSKLYFDLPSKIKKRIALTFPNPKIETLFRKLEKAILRITITRQDNDKYNEDKLGYPWKEYSSNQQIQEWCKYKVPEDKVEYLRRTANDIWNALVKEREEKAEEEQSYYDYISSNVTITPDHGYTKKIQMVMQTILRFRKQQFTLGKATSIQLSRLKDQATSYLYFHNYITEEEIIAYDILGKTYVGNGY